MAPKIFIFGIGAQKAGTTWLSKYLATSPGVARGEMKEYHIWDWLHSPTNPSKQAHRPTWLHAARYRLGMIQRHKHRYSPLCLRMREDTEAYFDYFSGLLKPKNMHIAYDITPSYMTLPTQTFQKIEHGFSKRGVDTKVIFLLRDPVERCWSSARMAKNRDTGRTDVTGEEVLQHALLRESEVRTRYDLTRAALAQAFTDDRIYAGLYEEMHQPEKIMALSAFCGVPARFDMIEKRLNARPKTVEIDAGIKAQIARHYHTVYDQAARIFPQSLELWPGFRYL
jgi:hypothetical protein